MARSEFEKAFKKLKLPEWSKESARQEREGRLKKTGEKVARMGKRLREMGDELIGDILDIAAQAQVS